MPYTEYGGGSVLGPGAVRLAVALLAQDAPELAHQAERATSHIFGLLPPGRAAAVPVLSAFGPSWPVCPEST